MKNVRLFHSATIVGDSKGVENSATKLTKRARFVYEGEFDSMDGPVKVTRKHISALVAAHNSGLAKLSAATGMANYPPVQVDHSTSGWDTVGRVTGSLEEGEDEVDGKKVWAMFGNLCFLGTDAVERVNDGRWTHLSLGADLDGAKLNEMTVTPFPAAPKASLLSRGDKMDEKKLAALKKHLMEKEKLSEKDADDKLAGMKDDEKEELSASLSGDEGGKTVDKTEGADETEKEVEKGTKDEQGAGKKMAAARTAFTKLSKGFKKNFDKTSKAITKVQLTAKLSGLRAKGKLSPVEQKAIDLDKLASLDKAGQDFFFEAYEKRSPIVLAGVYGRADATDVVELAKDVKGKQMLGEMMEGMHFSKGVVKRLAGGAMPTSMRPGDTATEMSEDNIGSSVGNDTSMPTSMDTPMQMSAHFKHLHQLMEEGRHDEAKEHLARCMEHAEKMGQPEQMPGGQEGPQHLSALAENVESLQNQFEELVQLVTPILGTEA